MGSPSQPAIEVHIGREMRQWPALRPRTTRPSAVRIVSSRVMSATSADHFVPGAAVKVPPSVRERVAELPRGCLAAGQVLDDRAGRRRGSSPPPRARLERDRLLGEPASLGIGDPASGAAHDGRQQVPGDDPHGPSHRHRPDDRPAVIQRGLDIGDGEAAHPGVERQVRRRRLGGMPRGHGRGRGLDRVVPVVRVQAMAAGDPGAAMVVGRAEHQRKDLRASGTAH